MARDKAFKRAEEKIGEARRTGATQLNLTSWDDSDHLALTELPESLAELSQLQTLGLWDNKLTSLPEWLGQLTELQTLDVSDNQLISLPNSLSQLTRLQTLDLGSNHLTGLPESVSRLRQLTKLYLYDNQLTELPESLGELTRLESLTAWGNQLNALPESLGQLIRLKILSISHNQFITLPHSIGPLTHLTELYVSRNQLTSLPESIGQLNALELFFLEGNQLTSLPESLRQLKNLRGLFLHDNESLGLPPEVLGPRYSGTREVGGDNEPAKPEAILDYYFRSRRETTQPLLEAKILVLGQGAVGKTSLTKRLLDESAFDSLEPTTRGINIGEWPLQVSSTSADHAQSVRVRIWDFGGQEIMHATHQFFLTKRSLYLLVLDSRKGESESNLNYWLKIIQSYGGVSPVIIVMNKCDEFRLELNERAIQREYAPNVAGFVHASAKTGEGLDKLRQMIQTQISSMPHVFNRVPNTYLRIKNEIEAIAHKKDFLEESEFDLICARNGLDNPDERKQLLRFLHDLGSVLNFDDPADPYGLRDTKILNPEWVTKAVYRIINNPLLMEQREGELEANQLGRILGDPERYPEKQHQYILDIMRKFELCFEFPTSQGKRYLIPELLPVREPDLDWTENHALRFEYHYEVLPGGIICRLIVRNSAYIGKPPTYWRTGVVFQIGGNQSLVRADMSRNRIVIEVKGPAETRRNALTIIRRELDHIHRTIPKLEVSGRVPLPGESVLVDYNHLLKLQDLGVDRHYFEGANRQYSVKELLTGLQPPESAPETLYIRRMVLENIRCFQHLELEFNAPGKFRPMTMLLGDNGVGKTTVLRCLALGLCDETGASALTKELAGEMLYDGADTGSIRITCGSYDSAGRSWDMETVLTRGLGDSIELKKEFARDFPLQRLFVCGYGALRRGFGDKSYQGYDISDSVSSLFDYSAAMQNPELVFRRIQSAGHDLRELRERLAHLLELETNAVQIDSRGISITGPWGMFIPVGAVGDGYQATLAWLADFFGWALFYDERFFSRRLSGVVLVDEIEKHLHPRWQRQVIRKLHDQFPDVQFIVTSHSPICAGGISDLAEGDGALFHFSSDLDKPVLTIEPPAGWRYDQIITSSAFGLSSSRDVTTEAIQERLRKAYEEHGENARDSQDFNEAMQELASRSVTAAQDEMDRDNRNRLATDLEAVRNLLEAEAND